MVRAHFSKKAQVAEQFNWVFILIAGSIILAFFVSVGVWYKGRQEVTLAGDVVTKLDSIFSTAKESPKTAKINKNFPDVTLTFFCDADACNDLGCASGFSGGSVTIDTSTEPLFTLKTLGAKDMITWALSWELPYKVTNFLYLTNPRVRYVLVTSRSSSSSTALLSTVNSLLSENSFLVKEVLYVEDVGSTLTLEDRDEEHIRIVYFTDNVLDPLPFDVVTETSFDALTVSGSKEFGLVSFEGEDYPYLGIAMLIGAIFSEDASFYSCNAQKAINQLAYVSTMYHRRTEDLYATVASSPKAYCQIYYDLLTRDALQTLKATEYSAVDVSALEDALSTLIKTDQLAIVNDCPRLY